MPEIVCLIRPMRGRLVAGVARGIAEVYRIPVVIVRALIVAALLATPATLLLYLLLAISIPGEEFVLARIRLAPNADERSGRMRFERLTRLLWNRVDIQSERHLSTTRHVLALVLLLLGTALEIPHLEGSHFYFAHPILSGMFSTFSRIGTTAFYLTAAVAALSWRPAKPPEVELALAPSHRLMLEPSPSRSIGGLAAGVARVIGLDVAYVRVFFILLNVLTFGVFGVLYLVTVFLMRRKEKAGAGEREHRTMEYPRRTAVATNPMPTRLQWMLSFLFFTLAAIRTITEFRLFFFNEPLFDGVIFSVMGLLVVLHGLKHLTPRSSVLVIAGASILLLGVEHIASTAFRVQLTTAGRFEEAYLLAALAILYFSAVLLNGFSLRLGASLAAICVVACGLVVTGAIPARFLLALTQFYDFFYPVIFAGFGLWLAME